MTAASLFAKARDEARSSGVHASEGCGWAPLPKLSRVPEVRLPNEFWLEFLSGPLTADDWALIERVEAGEVSVDDAMLERRGL